MIVEEIWSTGALPSSRQGSARFASGSGCTWLAVQPTSHFSERRNSFCSDGVSACRLAKKARRAALAAEASRPHSEPPGATPDPSRRYRDRGKQVSLGSSSGPLAMSGENDGIGPAGHALRILSRAACRCSALMLMRAFASEMIFLFWAPFSVAKCFAASSEKPNASDSISGLASSSSSIGGRSSLFTRLLLPAVSAAAAAAIACGSVGWRSLYISDSLAQPPSGQSEFFAFWSSCCAGTWLAETGTSRSLRPSLVFTHPAGGPTLDRFVKCRRSPTSSCSSMMAPFGRHSASSCEDRDLPSRTMISSPTTCHSWPIMAPM